MIYLKNDADTEDIFQTVFLKYVLSSVSFENDEHEKAWFIRVTINACKDLLRNFFRSHTVSLDEIMEYPSELPPDYREVWEAVFSLPQNYRDVVYLHYFEEYMKINDRNPQIIFQMAMCCKAKGDEETADQLFGQVIMNFSDSELAERAKAERGY